MSESDLPDVEGAVRTYLRADAGCSATFGGRIFFGVDDPSSYPVCTLQRIGGGFAGGTAERSHVDLALLQLDVWGGKHDKAGAWTGASAVIKALHALQRYSTASVLLHAADVQSWAFLPDDGERARYSITAQIICSPL